MRTNRFHWTFMSILIRNWFPPNPYLKLSRVSSSTDCVIDLTTAVSLVKFDSREEKLHCWDILL